MSECDFSACPACGQKTRLVTQNEMLAWASAKDCGIASPICGCDTCKAVWLRINADVGAETTEILWGKELVPCPPG
jgi:hypothetical protein